GLIRWWPRQWLRFPALVLMSSVWWLTACGTSHQAPVVDRFGNSQTVTTPTSSRGVHVVAKGETLYSIAWRHGKDFRQLAAANGISAPYPIYPGQQIRLDGQAKPTPAPRPPAQPAPTNKPPTPPVATKPAPTAPAATTGSAPLAW